MSHRFVILRHDVNGTVHWDLMLEIAGQEKLRTLQLANWPLEPGESCPCTELPPHRAAYLDYEGEVSDNRGTVTRVAKGTWTGGDAAIRLDIADSVQLTLAISANHCTRRS